MLTECIGLWSLNKGYMPLKGGQRRAVRYAEDNGVEAELNLTALNLDIHVEQIQ